MNINRTPMDFEVSEERQKSSRTVVLSNDTSGSFIHDKHLTCTVCGASATGFNFSVISCMCCKAFFRRNALAGVRSLQCRYFLGDCSINTKTRRDCSYCRLKKCFEVGMKKELIVTEDLKRLRREKLVANRQARLHVIRSMSSLNTNEKSQCKQLDLSHLVNIYNAFEEWCRLPLIQFEKDEQEQLCHQPIKSRIKFQHYATYFRTHESSLINFFQHLPEFKQFSNDQQLALSKHNIRFLIRISLMEVISDRFSIWPGIHLLLETIFGKALIEEINILLLNFKDQVNDSICIRLLLIIFLFATFNTYTGRLNTVNLYKIQEKYTELLWLYLRQRYGETTACEKLSVAIRYCLHLQTIGHTAELKRQEAHCETFFLSLD